MNNEKMGNFISEMRRSQNLTQKELAAKLEITDKAISKWERGISCPDISLLIPLAQILGVTTSELLNGERCAAPEKSKDVLVEETLLYSDRSAAQKADRMKGILFTFFSSSVILAAVICFICDFCIAGQLTWSLLVAASLLFGWLLLLPLFKARKNIVRKLLLMLTLTVIPYLAVLSRLLALPAVYKMGAVIAVISLLGLWCIYIPFLKIPQRKLYVTGIILLVIIPVMWGINGSVSFFIQQPLEPSTKFVDSLTTLVLLIIAVFCFGKEFLRNRKQ